MYFVLRGDDDEALVFPLVCDSDALDLETPRKALRLFDAVFSVVFYTGIFGNRQGV